VFCYRAAVGLSSTLAADLFLRLDGLMLSRFTAAVYSVLMAICSCHAYLLPMNSMLFSFIPTCFNHVLMCVTC